MAGIHSLVVGHAQSIFWLYGMEIFGHFEPWFPSWDDLDDNRQIPQIWFFLSWESWKKFVFIYAIRWTGADIDFWWFSHLTRMMPYEKPRLPTFLARVHSQNPFSFVIFEHLANFSHQTSKILHSDILSLTEHWYTVNNPKQGQGRLPRPNWKKFTFYLRAHYTISVPHLTQC